MKGDCYQPRGTIREVLFGSLVIGHEGRIAETDAEAAQLDGYPSLVCIPAPPVAVAAPKPKAAAKPRAPRKPKTAVVA